MNRTMFAKIRGFVAVAVVIALAYPAFLFGGFLGNETAELPQAIAERPYSVLVGVVVNLVVLGFLLWLIRRQSRTTQASN